MNPPNFEREEGGVIRNWRTPILELWDSPGYTSREMIVVKCGVCPYSLDC